jgi:hypothetical protein
VTFTPATSVAPGWYADPMAPGQARWWSGLDWTHHVQPVSSIPGQALAGQSWDGGLLLPRERTLPVRALVWGIVAVIINPVLAPSILAIVYGIMALIRADRLVAQGAEPFGRSRAIAGIVLGSLGAVAAIVWVAVFVALAPHN